MLAKLIVHGHTREQAIARMHRALLELTVDGIETSRDFHLRVMENEEFRRGDISIQWLEQRMEQIVQAPAPAERVRAAAIAAALIAHADRGATGVTAAPSAPAPADRSADGWRRAALLEGLR
jgi:acetyl-CoA carboxylase biotin carboxylase subunit